MAEVLESFDGVLRAGAKYPWDLWLDGRVWKLKRGEDFDQPIARMRTQTYTAGRTRGVLVQTRKVDEDTLLVRAVKP